MLDMGIITHSCKCIGLAHVLMRSSQLDHGINNGEGELVKTGKKNIRVVMCLQCRRIKLLGGVWPDDVCWHSQLCC
jgi:hypothetical protein